jgi:hypothetical protein
MLTFDHWDEYLGNSLEEGSNAYVVVEEIRKCKGLIIWTDFNNLRQVSLTKFFSTKYLGFVIKN